MQPSANAPFVAAEPAILVMPELADNLRSRDAAISRAYREQT
jgi:hypothetical protein